MKKNYDINAIKDKILALYKKNEVIHVTINVKKKNAKNREALIINVYKNFFVIKSKVNLYEEEFTISYIDLLIDNIAIKELDLV